MSACPTVLATRRPRRRRPPRHFAARLAFETDVSDVHADLEAGTPGLVVVDSRNTQAWEQGHLPGAVHLPTAEIAARAPSLIVRRDAVVVTYCWGPGCNGATRAALAFATLGYRVKEMIGGYEYWVREGFAVETAADGRHARRPADRPVVRHRRATADHPMAGACHEGRAARPVAPGAFCGCGSACDGHVPWRAATAVRGHRPSWSSQEGGEAGGLDLPAPLALDPGAALLAHRPRRGGSRSRPMTAWATAGRAAVDHDAGLAVADGVGRAAGVARHDRQPGGGRLQVDDAETLDVEPARAGCGTAWRTRRRPRSARAAPPRAPSR